MASSEDTLTPANIAQSVSESTWAVYRSALAPQQERQTIQFQWENIAPIHQNRSEASSMPTAASSTLDLAHQKDKRNHQPHRDGKAKHNIKI